MKRRIAWERIFGLLFGVVTICFLLWFVASFIDTNICNTPFTERYQNFAPWNLFAIFFD